MIYIFSQPPIPASPFPPRAVILSRRRRILVCIALDAEKITCRWAGRFSHLLPVVILQSLSLENVNLPADWYL